MSESTAARQSIDTTHDGCIHDAQVDFNGKFLATGGSDGLIKINEIRGDKETEVQSIEAHAGAVWQVAWAHPRAVGNVSTLASCGQDGKVIVWRESSAGKWDRQHIAIHTHEGGACTVAWAPFEHGCVLASGGADGQVMVMVNVPSVGWDSTSFLAHPGGCTTLSWAPFLSSGALIQNVTAVKRFATGGCDGQIRVWEFMPNVHKYEQRTTLSEHSRNGVVAIRSIHWAPNVGLPFDYIATCADDKQVIVWRQEMPGKEWKHRVVTRCESTPCRVAWSMAGSLLAVSLDDGNISVHKEEPSGDWGVVSRLSG